jgi:hypothetical protein
MRLSGHAFTHGLRVCLNAFDNQRDPLPYTDTHRAQRVAALNAL